MREIVFLSTYSFNEPVVKNRLTPFIKLALERGLTVSLVNPVGGKYQGEDDENFRHIAINISQANRGNYVVRTFREYQLARAVLKAAPNGGDYVFITIPSMFLLFLSSIARSPIKILDIRDLTWEYLSDNAFIARSAKRFFRFLAQRMIPKFDHVLVTNEFEKCYIENKTTFDPVKSILCPNGISLEQFENITRDQPISTKRRKRPLVAYIGNIGIAQNLITLVEAAKLMPEVDFQIVGGGSDFERVRSAAASVGNLKMTGRIEWDQIPLIYRESDILYAQLSKEFESAMPSKLYEYLATGKNVIYGGTGQALRILSDFDSVKVVIPDDVAALAKAIKEILDAGFGRGLNMLNREKIRTQFIRETAVENVYRRIFHDE